MTNWIHGSKLSAAQRAEVLRTFVHRYTGQHRPSWSHEPMPNGTAYEPQHATDQAWLDAYAFPFVADGSRLSRLERWCEPTYMHTEEVTENGQIRN